jgi:predicted ester cyclase
MLFAAFPDQKWTIEELIAEGDKVVNRFTWRGTHRGDFLGIAPTGSHVEVKGVVIDRFADGKIADTRIQMDNLGLMQQLGVVPTPQQD